MALQYGFTGFETFSGVSEGGSAGTLFGRFTKNTNPQFSTDRPYSGLACLKCRKQTAVACFSSLNNTFSGGTNKHARMRVRIRVNSYPDVTHTMVAGFGNAGIVGGKVQMDLTGHLRANAQGTVTSYTGTALALDTWYLLEIRYTVQANFDVSNNDRVVTELILSTAGGGVLESITATLTATSLAENSLQPATVGDPFTTLVKFDLDFDDFVFVANEGATAAFPDSVLPEAILPTATRVTPIVITGQGTNAGWTGDWRNCRDVPMDTNVITDQTVTATNAITTFAHKTAAALGVGNIQGTRLLATLKATSAGVDAVMLWGSELPVTLTTGYTQELWYSMTWNPGPPPGWVEMNPATFDGSECGAKNKRGVALQLATLMAEVLHDGNELPDTAFADTKSYASKIITWTGNGAFQTISGVGFAPHFVMVKRVPSGGAGCLWIRRLGGTISFPFNTSTADMVAVQAVTADGFELGPSPAVNASGVTYVAVCLKDSGGGVEGRYFDTGSYWGDGTDDRNIVLSSPFQPELVFIVGLGTITSLKSSYHVGEDSIQIGTGTGGATNAIQALTSTGFQLGTLAAVNQASVRFCYAAWRRGATGALDGFFAFGSFTATGSTSAVLGIFSPKFVFADARPTVFADAIFRSSALHSGTNSSNWGSGNTLTTGFTSFVTGVPCVADGFNVGSTLSISGETCHWVACSDGEVPPALAPVAGFPVIESTATSQSGSVTSHTVTMPAGITAGDLLLVFVGFGSEHPLVTWPAGWTAPYQTWGDAGGPDVKFVCLSKIAAGSDALTFTTSVAVRSVHVTYRLSHCKSGCVMPLTHNYGNGLFSGPGDVTPVFSRLDALGVAKKFLWLAACAWRNGTVAMCYAPSNYGNPVARHDSNAAGAGCMVVSRQVDAANEDPSDATLSGTICWHTLVVAVLPEEADAPDPVVGDIFDLTWPVAKQDSGMLRPEWIGRPPQDTAPVDLDYPRILASEAVKVITVGPRKVLTTDRSMGEDSVTAGVWLTELGPEGPTAGSPDAGDADPWGGWWNAQCGRCTADYQLDDVAWGEGSFHVLFELLDGWDTPLTLAVNFDPGSVGTDPGSAWLELDYYTWDEGTINVLSYELRREVWVNKRVRFTVSWQCGTPILNSTGQIDDGVAADGFLRVDVTDLATNITTSVYNLQGIPLYMSDGYQDGEPGANYLNSVWLGYYGLFGHHERLFMEGLVPPPPPPPTEQLVSASAVGLTWVEFTPKGET